MSEEDHVDKIYTLPPPLTKEDLKQEKELSRLTGKKPPSWRRNLVKELAYGYKPPANSVPIGTPPAIDLESIVELTEWLLIQSEKVKEAVLDYLDSPKDNQLWRIMSILELRFIAPPKKSPSTTLTSVILDSLPSTKEELFKVALQEFVSKRPEAAVRTILRNLVRRGVIVKNEEEVYRKVSNENVKTSEGTG